MVLTSLAIANLLKQGLEFTIHVVSGDGDSLCSIRVVAMVGSNVAREAKLRPDNLIT